MTAAELRGHLRRERELDPFVAQGVLGRLELCPVRPYDVTLEPETPTR